MAIKDLFSKQKQQTTAFRGAHQESLDEFRQSVESTDEIKEIRREDAFVTPDLDYASASNFAKFGSATKYYADTIKRIHSQYPYDGSNAEKLKFKNDLTQLERYVLDNEYPKSTGYITVAADGWGARDSVAGDWGIPVDLEYIQFYSHTKTALYDTGSNHRGNLHLNWYSGSCVEFWMKKDDFPGASLTNNEAICQISGGNSPDGHQLTLFIDDGPTNANRFGLDYYTTADDFGSAAAEFQANIDLTRITTFADSTWHHYAIDFQQTSATALRITAYVDGVFDNEQTVAVSAMPAGVSGSLIGVLGATGNTIGTVADAAGAGKLSGSLDEFRVWRKTRSGQEIGRNYFTTINGGINTDLVKYDDDHPVDLGVYFKFNAGITGITATDSTVLDYGGGLSNGVWTGYSSNSRNTGSAITSASVGVEEGDPIIYSLHPDVQTLSTNLERSGTLYDAGNMGNLQNSMPLWMLDDDRVSGGNLANLLQIIGSYLDSLYLQISQISKFHNADYHDNNNVPSNPYNSRLLTSLGFDAPEFFIDKTVLETIVNQDNKRKFEDKLNEIKNLIYKNIYNNLTYINKSKGTVKSIRNLLRCYGVDDDLFNFNVYADKADFFLEDDYKNSSIKFDSLDLTPFADTQNSEGVIYNFSGSANTNSSPYISGSANENVGFTVEANIVFPKTPSTYYDTVNLTSLAIVTASVFGTRAAVNAARTTVPPSDDAEITVYAIKVDNTAKFQLTSSLGLLIESDRFYDVYENSQWNLSIRIKPVEYPFNSEVTGASGYTVEFAGYNYIQDILHNSFSESSTLSSSSGDAYVAADKRIYAGAERTNITGTLQTRSNMKLLSVLAWENYLEDDELSAHAKDVTSFGRSRPYKNSFVFQGADVSNTYIPKTDTLAMYWGFNQVTSSDDAGEFVVPDLDSGSINLINKYGTYSQVTDVQNTAQGSGFPASSDVKDIQYLNISTQQIPENLNSDNMIKVLDSDDDLFFVDNRPVRLFFSMEASMYDTISREMLKTFAGVLDYASMIGSPIVEHQTENKELRIAREVFFSKVENTPDLEKYVSLYKFLDSAIESVLLQLIPASADVSERVRTVIENHIFERPHRRKHLIPNAKSVSTNDDNNCDESSGKCGDGNAASNSGNPVLPPKQCCDDWDDICKSTNVGWPTCKSGTTIGSALAYRSTLSNNNTNGGNGQLKINVSTQDMLWGSPSTLEQFLNFHENKTAFGANNSNGYNGWYLSYAVPTVDYEPTTDDGAQKTQIGVFASVKAENILNVFRPVVAAQTYTPFNTSNAKINQHGNIILPIIEQEAPVNIITLEKDTNQSIIESDLIKNFISFDVSFYLPTDYYSELGGLQRNRLPISFKYDSGGEFFGTSSGSIIGNHRDVYYANLEVPMQGPFTETHVGGYKNRHQAIGETSDRPELYKIDTGATGGPSATTVRVYNPRINPDTSAYDFNIPRVKYSREDLVKRVYNIRNIKTVTGSYSLRVQGNYDKNYQVVNTCGRTQNNPAFVQAAGFDLAGTESPIVSGVIDYALPSRALSDGTYNKTVFVNRFSSPGEVATMGEGYLDADAGEFSPYNALPYRNRQVVNNLNTFLSIPTAFGGYQSGSSVTASFHKVQRNRVDRLRYNAAGTLYTGSLFDNGFVTHGIPNKDFGYLWISASADPSSSMDALYGFANSAVWPSGGITFYSGTLREPTDINYVINFAGYITPAELISQAGIHYELNVDQNLLEAPTIFTTAGTTAPRSTGIYFLNINGDYRYPSWKQMRGGQHPVARHLRENNYIIADTTGDALRVQHSPLSSKYLPVLHNIRSHEVLGGVPTDKDLLLTYTFGTNYDFYGNFYDSVNNKLANPFRKNFETAYQRDSLLYGISQLYTGEHKAISLNSLAYRVTVWPKETNTYRSIARDRTDFLFKWRDSLTDRLDQITGSQASTDYSMWPMDTNGTSFGELMNANNRNSPLSARFGRYSLAPQGTTVFSTLTASAPRNTVQFGTDDSAGQGPFDDTYAAWNEDLRLIAKDYSIIPEYRISDYIGDIVDSGFDVIKDSYQSLTLTGSQATSNNKVFLERYVHSDNIPSIEIVRETQQKDVDRISLTAHIAKKFLPYEGFEPVERTKQLSTLFSQSLAPNTTLTGADASFQTMNNAIFSRLTYGSVRAGIAIDTAIWDSGSLGTNEQTYATASFLITSPTDLFDDGDTTGLAAYVILSSSVGTAEENFKFSTSFAAGVGTAGDPYTIVGSSADAASVLATAAATTINASSSYFSAIADGAMVTASAIFAGPAGASEELWLDVDHFVVGGAQPAYTGSYHFTQPGTGTLLSWRRRFHGYAAGDMKFYATASFSRLPFETIISPSAYLNASSSIIENDPQNPFNSTASVGAINTKYGLAASNFYAGVVDTFIEGSNLTTIQSAPETEWSFDGTYNNFTMDIVVVKDKDFSNHDDPAANGAPYTAHACFYQPLSASSGEWWDKHISDGSSSVGAEIPPNASWSENEAYVTINFDYNTFKNVVTDRGPTFEDILAYSTQTFANKQMLTQLGTDSATSTGSSNSQFMTVEAGVDLFNYNANNKTWQPTVRWECPIHNYTAVDSLFPDETSGGTGTSAGDANKGVWNQYSTDTSNGLRLYVRGPDVMVNRTSGSLAQACGFEVKQKPIGQLAKSIILREYLVAIPFVTNDCDEEVFFHYDINEFERAYSRIGKEREGSLTEMLAKLRSLILPIKFNFMDKRDSAGERLEQEDYLPILPPFAMYVFEATDEIDQEGVSKAWQGVLTDAGTRATFEKFNITHEIKAGQIISPKTLNNDLFGGKLPKEMRFKIFKAKYRSNLSYPQLKMRANGEELLQKSVLGYNYPHDFYSLIETAKIDLGLEYYPKEEDEFNLPQVPGIAESALLDAASTILKKSKEQSDEGEE